MARWRAQLIRFVVVYCCCLLVYLVLFTEQPGGAVPAADGWPCQAAVGFRQGVLEAGGEGILEENGF